LDPFGFGSGRVSDTAQLVATVITSVLTVGAIVATVVYARKRRIFWPIIVLVTGGICSLMEPLFDRLYGLWFFTGDQWTAFHFYGIAVPAWLPVVYVFYYGAWTVWLVNRWQKGATRVQVALLYLGSVLLAFAFEQFYIHGFGLYGYQGSQPLRVFGYPIWVTFVNGVPPFLASIIYVRLIPLLEHNWEYLALLWVVPFSFAAVSFGSAFPYVAYRNGNEAAPNMTLLTILAVVAAVASYATVMLAARLAGLDKNPVGDQRTKELEDRGVIGVE
jgi:hypothetical protein